MDDLHIEETAKRSARSRVARLFRVLVVGGAVLAAVGASAIHRGGVGTPRGGSEDGGDGGGGGTPGW